MHPAFIWYWKSQRARDAWCGSHAFASADCAPRAWRSTRPETEIRVSLSGRHQDSLFGGGGLGVRRPLRFLAYRLDLTDQQTGEVAKVIERLKTERAQAEVDLRRAAADLADALEAAEFGGSQADSARRRRIEAAERVQDAVSRAVRDLHALLEPYQREELAGLVRSGSIQL